MKPIKFYPLLKSKLWGGDKIIAFKQIPSKEDNVGESWEISGVPGDETIAKEGECNGMGINAMVKKYRGQLMGERNYQRFGDEFPLLIKFIDARQDLSIQVHPSDETAQKHGLKHGKTEMWYIMESSQDAKLFSGLKKQLSSEEYKEMVEKDTICEALAQYKVKEGDVFFLPGGRIHSIGKGCFLVEIQQTSDVTYRIYDFKRKDKNGNYRELHIEEAAQSIDYHVEESYRTDYISQTNRKISLVNCPYFRTSVYDLNKPMTIDYGLLDSFVILIGMRGNGLITDNEGNTTTLKAGETILIPATTKSIKVEGTIKFLETYI
ncbi:MAG: class I mannose-6-phosphate isomerase [Prevotella sp.]|nr:class I mannose-6-phosphate isomerase [Prevotella sp.]